MIMVWIKGLSNSGDDRSSNCGTDGVVGCSGHSVMEAAIGPTIFFLLVHTSLGKLTNTHFFIF